MEAIILITAIGLLTLLAVASLRFGVESREGFTEANPNAALRGFIWSR